MGTTITNNEYCCLSKQIKNFNRINNEDIKSVSKHTRGLKLIEKGRPVKTFFLTLPSAYLLFGVFPQKTKQIYTFTDVLIIKWSSSVGKQTNLFFLLKIFDHLGSVLCSDCFTYCLLMSLKPLPCLLQTCNYFKY